MFYTDCTRKIGAAQPHCGYGAVVQALVCKQHRIFDEHSDAPEHEGHKQVEVDAVACAKQLPGGTFQK